MVQEDWNHVTDSSLFEPSLIHHVVLACNVEALSLFLIVHAVCTCAVPAIENKTVVECSIGILCPGDEDGDINL